VLQGWEAPALGALSRSPVPWTEDQLVRYLQRGHDPLHGMAGGAMAPVVRGLAQVPAEDVRAIAHYLVSLQTERSTTGADALLARSREQAAVLRGPAQRMFETACGACHHDGDGPELTGLNAPLALNPNLHSARPDNLLRTILDGIQDPAFIEIGHMPAFRHALNDAQIAELAAYMRQRFAPGQPPWRDLGAAVARARAQR
jgi:nicotinate dehydrogenase subunit B